MGAGIKIEISHLSKNYGEKQALREVSLVLEPGVYALLGPNGAGKSTMIGLLTDSIRRNQGKILCNGRDILEMGAEYRSMLGYMPQQQRMYDHYTALDFLKYISVLKGLKAKEAAKQIEDLLHVVNLWDVRRKRIGGFSGGMKQRIMLAQALLGEPGMLILDEPTAGLDPSERINLRHYIAGLSKEKIVLFATHVVSDIQEIAKEVILLKDGEIVKQGSPQELVQSLGAEDEDVDLENVYMYYMGKVR